MKKVLLLAIAFAFCLQAATAQMLDTVRIQMTGLDGTTKISSDDAEQINAEIDKLYDDDLDAGWEGDEFNVAITGLVFRGVKVPKNAIIDSAFIALYAHEDEGDLAIITLKSEATDSAVTYNDTDLISARNYNASSVVWECSEDWTIWEPYRTPDIKALIQDVVSRNGWKAGNAIGIMMAGQDQGASTEDNARDMEAFENVEDPDDGGDGLNHPERIPQLVIYYRMPSSAQELLDGSVLALSPNPSVDGRFNLSLDAFAGQEVTVFLYDQTGRAVQNWVMLPSGTTALHTDVANGVYTLQVRSATHTAVAKLIIRR